MAATAPAPPWNPEDDLLLKNAVEAGATLEALAKGAVRFSRKFSMLELRERWSSLLYDVDVATQASSRMLEFEACGSNIVPNKLNSFSQSRVGSKRKAESIRKQYYALKKRLCADRNFASLNDFDINFLGGQAIGNQGSLYGNCMVGGGVELVFNGNGGRSVFHGGGECVALENRGVDGLGRERCGVEFTEHVLLVAANDLPENIGTQGNSAHVDLSGRRVNAMDFGNSLDVEDIGAHLWDVAAPEMPTGETLVVANDMDNDGDNMDSQYEVGNNEGMLVGAEGSHELDRPTAISGGDYGDMADSLFSDEVNSILLSSPKDVHNDHVSEFCEPPMLVSASCEVLDDMHAAEMNVSFELSQTGDMGDLQDILYSDPNMPSSSYTSIPLSPNEIAVDLMLVDAPVILVAPEVQEENMICLLNNEDPDIPCNDDTVFPTAVVPTSPQLSSERASNLATLNNCDQQMITSEKKEDQAQQFTKESPNPPLDKNDIASTSQCRLADGTLLTEQEINVPGMAQLATAELGPSSMAFPEPQTTSALDYKESDDDVDDDEDDTDIPYFSDMETMIHEMDLCPADEEPDINRRVSKYQNEDAKRKIIRLEQCAQSSMQRALTSKGALAVLYDHHVKHFIKKSEVIIGRTTEDNQVDIDLGDNKVSRRQALIKMDTDGSFSLKNLGKNSIFLNGREIATGKILSFASSNLIEIREMAFVFEINHKSVKRYLVKIAT